MWLGHSSVLIEVDGLRVLLDPVLSSRVSPFSFVGPKRFHPSPIALEDMRNIDAVMISHNHYDHMDEATIKHLAAKGTKILVPLGMRPQLKAWGVDDAQAHSFHWGEELTVKNVRLVSTPARHYSNRGTFDYKKTHWSSWSIIGPQSRVFYSGDTGYSKSFAKTGESFGPFDLGIIKVGAYGPGQSWKDIHMEPEDSVRTAQDVKAEVLLPVHWGTFNLAYHAWDEPIERTLKSAEKSGLRVVAPRPGEMVDPVNATPIVSWWREVN